MIPFTTVGSGRIKVLALPGLFGAAPAFAPMLEYAELERFQHVVMNYRGYGPAVDIPGLFTLREIVVDAMRLLDYLGWRSAHVIGHSMGALAAQMVAVAAPSRVASIVSIAGLSARGAPRDAARAQLFARAATDRNVCASIIEVETGARYTSGFAMSVAGLTVGKVSQTALSHYVQDMQDPATSDIHRQIRGSRVPFLALVGKHDPACPEGLARETTLSWYPNARLEVLDGGHYPMLECPAATVSSIERFLNEVEAALAATPARSTA
jgi:pimeloyl-ACP methyl ester carboxylesterase